MSCHDLPQSLGDVLPRHLHQPQGGDLDHVGLGAVEGELGLQGRENGFAVGLRRHVDEIDDDDAADVPQPKLADDLSAGLEVGLERRVFQVSPAHVASGVDVDHRHGLGVIDDDVPARGQLDPAGQGLLDLPFQTQPAEQWLFVLIALHPLLELGRHGMQVACQPSVKLLVVHDDRRELGPNKVADTSDRQLDLHVDERRRAGRARAAFGAGPHPLQKAEVALYRLPPRSLGGGAHDHPPGIRCHRTADAPQPFPLLRPSRRETPAPFPVGR